MSRQQQLDAARARLAVRVKALAAARRAAAKIPGLKAAVAQTRRTIRRLRKPPAPGPWMAGVVRDPVASIGGFTGSEPARGVLHTTEGLDFAGADRTLKGAGSCPHFLVGTAGQIKQYRPVTDAATALEHPAGTPETNRMHAVQIEVCALAAHPRSWPAPQRQAVARVMAFCTGHGIPLRCTVTFTDFKGVRRLSDAAWAAYNGWLGHQHVPHQPSGHWDPGAIDVSELLTAARKVTA